MPATVSQINVATQPQLDQAINSYIAQGFMVMNRTASSATMFKKKEFNLIWAVIGFFLCLIPLLIYLIKYALEKDLMVEIRIDPAAAGGQVVQMSADGRYWWDGAQWQDAERAVPPAAQRSGDNRWWWDGSTWRQVPSQSGLPPSGEVPARTEPPSVAVPPPPARSDQGSGEGGRAENAEGQA
jgi:hypothetical protein